MSLSIVIPVFNEEESLVKLTEEILDVLKDEPRFDKSEIIFVDDGSTDGSLQVLQQIKKNNSQVRVLSLRRNFGKATALKEGFITVRQRYVVTLDADLQDDPKNIKLLFDKLLEGNDLVVGWKKDRQDPLDKTIPSKIFNALIRRSTRLDLHDINSGLKIMKRQVAKELLIYGELHRFIPILAYQLGYRIAEVPVSHRERRYGASKYGKSRFLRGLMDLLTIMFLNTYGQRPLHLFGGIGLISLSVGFSAAIYLSYLKLLGQSIGTRPLLTFSVLLIIAGIQSFSTGLIAELLVNRTSKSAEMEEDE